MRSATVEKSHMRRDFRGTIAELWRVKDIELDTPRTGHTSTTVSRDRRSRFYATCIALAVTFARAYPRAIPPRTSLGQCASIMYRSTAQTSASVQNVAAPWG